MYSVVIIIIPANLIDSHTSQSFICDEENAKLYKEVLPSKIGNTLTVKTFPNNKEMKLTVVTKIS